MLLVNVIKDFMDLLVAYKSISVQMEQILAIMEHAYQVQVVYYLIHVNVFQALQALIVRHH